MSLQDFFFPAHIITINEYEEARPVLAQKFSKDEMQRLDDMCKKGHLVHRTAGQVGEYIDAKDLDDALEYLTSNPGRHSFTPDKLQYLREILTKKM